jgi:1-acylglycerone phosphate reductase
VYFSLDRLAENDDCGLGTPTPLIDCPMQLFRDIFEVNIFGVVMMCQEFVRLLIAAEGLIVNIGSVAPMMPLLYTGPYNASKGALHAYGDTLRVELKPFNVHVMTIISGSITSQITRDGKDAQIRDDSLYRPASEGFRRQASTDSDGVLCNFVKRLEKTIKN